MNHESLPAQCLVDVTVKGMWKHCSPELLRAGIDCANTPRRSCECAHGGAHDHFIYEEQELSEREAEGHIVEVRGRP